MNEVSKWVLVALLAESASAIGFVLTVGILQGRKTGKYPSLTQWVNALSKLQPFSRRGARNVAGRAARPTRRRRTPDRSA